MAISKQIIRGKFLKFLSVAPQLFLIMLVLLTIPLSAEGHPGSTDEDGCHYDRQDRYHCH